MHPGQPLNHQPDAVKGPQLPDKPVRAGPFQQGLLDPLELGVRQPGRRAAGSPAAQGIGAAGLPAGMPDVDGLG
jgi:hypothetical protein